MTKHSGIAPEHDTRLRRGFGAVTSRFLPTANCGASARRRAKGPIEWTEFERLLQISNRTSST
jgi:hypothetical protein